MFGFYSVKQAKMSGVYLYSTDDGKEVEITHISTSMEHGTKWDDIAFVGKVVDLIRKVSNGKLDMVPKEHGPDRLNMLIAITKEAIEEEEKQKSHRWN